MQSLVFLFDETLFEQISKFCNMTVLKGYLIGKEVLFQKHRMFEIALIKLNKKN